jgi:uncharacterized protein YcaQ
MGALQIDTISVVARSPYLVLWTRLGDYELAWLDELLAEGALFEYWAHAACFIPIEDYPFYRHRMIGDAETSRDVHVRRWAAANRPRMQAMLEHLRANGPVRSSDFERTDDRSGWWQWKDEKMVLEMLFTLGDVMIARRHNFQRVYDLRERVHPGWDDALLPAPDEARRALVLRAVRALGVTRAEWVPRYFYLQRAATMKAVSTLAAEGALHEVRVEGLEVPAFVHWEHLPLAQAAAAGRLEPSSTTILSPFDPLTSDRDRARAMFGFDYTIECYTPAARRKYGYFTLPILHRGRLVGRLDPKAHRREGVFEVKSVHLEAGVDVTDELVADLGAALRACAAWHRTPEVVVRATDPAKLARRLERAARGVNPKGTRSMKAT